jgi:hypothetical protein
MKSFLKNKEKCCLKVLDPHGSRDVHCALLDWDAV